MRVLLVTPENRFIRAFRRGQLNNFAQLTMAHLAAFVRPPHTVALVDEYVQHVDVDAPADLVGITCNTPNASHVYRLADAFRARGRMVVLGGPHPTLLPAEARAHADALVVGEAETTWPQVLADAARGALEPEYRAAEPPSLERLPPPRRDLIVGRGLLANAVVATRGCPHRCSYARDERLLAAAARAGCVCLFLGLESFSERSLELANKSFNAVESYAEVVARIHAHGITVQAGIVFGFDGDDEDTFEKTLVEATRLGLDGATVSLLTPFPGTPLFQQLERDGRLLTRDWSYYNGKTAVTFRPARMSPEALWNGYMWFRRQFFSRQCTLERLRRSGVRPLQSFALNWGYGRALENALPGWPIPGGERSAAVDWPGAPPQPFFSDQPPVVPR